MDAITICAANYLPFVSVLGNSFLDSNQGSTFTVLVIDSEKVEFERESKFRYLSPSDLDIPRNVFLNMAFYYNVTELATALKPSALKALIKMGSKKVIYLDPDIQVFSEFSELNTELDNNPIILTPHTLMPIPRDGLRPSESDIMGSGTFNLGFLALANSHIAMSLLNWWEERLRFDSISDPLQMLFTDQRWIDLVPSYFPIHILRHPGYNVAYWNLHERELGKVNGNVTVNDAELRFFHFSGYRPDKPWILSKYVSDKPRVVISNNPILIELCSQYGNKAISHGWESEISIEYGYQNFENGKFIPSSLRRLYREDCIKSHKMNEVLSPPVSWKEWACERSIDSGNLSRILFSIWKSRPDLKQRFPDATGTEAADLLAWAKIHGISEKVIDEEFLEIGKLQNDVIPSKFSRKKGINIAGYLNGELGLGQSARLILESANLTGLPVTTVNSNRTTSRKDEKFSNSNSEVIYPVTIAIVNADHFSLWVQDFGKEKLKETYVIGVWAWETEDFPKTMHSAFEYVDEIWAVSNFVKTAISKFTKKPVYVFPNPIVEPKIPEKLDRYEIGLSPERSYNLFIFDFASVFNRKNPLGLIEAHSKAFPNEDGPLLVIKSSNGQTDAVNLEKMRFVAKNRSDIFLIDKYLSREQLTALINECETYISLHRSEGYGLTMAEAMSLGKPVIATDYSGNLDFMNMQNSILVPYSKVAIGAESFPYLENSEWAEPDLNIAAQEMRNLWTNKSFAEKLGQQAKIDVTTRFSTKQAAEFVKQRTIHKMTFIAYWQRQILLHFIKLKKLIHFVSKFLKNPRKFISL